MRIIFRNTACDGIRRDAMHCASTALEFQDPNLYLFYMKFIKLTIIALVGLFVTTTSCKKEEPTPTPPTLLGLWELTSIREVYYKNSKILAEEITNMDPTEDGMERVHFKDASNGDLILKYPDDEEPQETSPFTYKFEGSKLTITDSDGDYIFNELNIQSQTLTMGIYEEDTESDPDRTKIYLTYKRL
jgi:hypothetical protein